METPSSASLTSDLIELRETVSETYEELQVMLVRQQQQQQQQQHQDDHETAVKTCMAAFNLAMGAALQKVNAVTTIANPEEMAALSKLTWMLLRIAPFLGNPNQNILIAQSAGAAVERFDFEPSLRSDEHCGFLFLNVANFLIMRARCLQEGAPTDTSDAVLQAFCPPLMVFFAKNLPLLATLRQQEQAIAINSLSIWRRPITMIRRLLLQLIDETILLVWAEKGDDNNNGVTKLTFGQRVRFWGLYVNKDLAAWAVSNDFYPPLVQAGATVEMASWTALRDAEQGVLCQADANPQKPHRIYPQGIPFDIPSLEGEKIVIMYQGKIERKLTGKVFPLINLEATKQGAPLTSTELQALSDRIQSAPTSAVKEAMEHQLYRGGPDDITNEALVRMQLASLTTQDQDDDSEEVIPLN